MIQIFLTYVKKGPLFQRDWGAAVWRKNSACQGIDDLATSGKSQLSHSS
jgi:hypothetical protein